MNRISRVYTTLLFVLMGSLTLFLSFYTVVPYFSDLVDLLAIKNKDFLIFLMSVAVLGVVLYCAHKFLKFNRRNFFLLLGVSITFKLLWIYIFSLEYYYDMTSVAKFAADILTIPETLPFNNYHYLLVYQYNIPIVFLNTLYGYIGGVENIYLIGRLVNVSSLVLIDVGIYLTTKELRNKNTAMFALFVSIVFLPFTAMAPVIYNDVTSCALFLYATYYLIKYSKTQDIKYLVLSCVCLVMGNTIRSIGWVVVIAYILYLMMDRGRKAIRDLVIIVSSVFIVNAGLVGVYKISGIIDQEENNIGIPIVHYLAIGSSPRNETHPPGYYESYFQDYIENNNYFYDKEVYKEIATSQHLDNLNQLGFFGFIEHYTSKFFYQWGDGTFETGIINNMIDHKQDSPITFQYESVIRDLIINTQLYRAFYLYSNGLWFIIVLVITMGLFNCLKSRNLDQIIVLLELIILGVMGFYVFWEISPHYSFVALPYFLVMFALMWDDLAHKKKELKIENN